MHPHRPTVDADSLHVLLEAIELLALLRGICCPITDPDQPHDPADAIALAWSLTLQIDACLSEMIDAAHDHGHTWNDIRDLFTPPTR